MLKTLLSRYLRFIIVAAVLGASSLVLLEMVHWIVGYESALAEGLWSWLIYSAGLLVNFQLQKRWVFESRHRPSFTLYTAWMLVSSIVVGVLSGTIFAQLKRHFPHMPLAASISMALALGLYSPVTFAGVSMIMRAHRGEASPGQAGPDR